MKTIKAQFHSIFSKLSKSKKRTRDNPHSYGSPASSQISSDEDESTTPKSVIRQRESCSSSAFADMFSPFRFDGDSRTTKPNLEDVLRMLSPHDLSTDGVVASMMAFIDREVNGRISLDEVRDIGMAALSPPVPSEELHDVFAAFDTDGDGKISAEELHRVFIAIGDGGCTIHDCHRMISSVDTYGYGFVCFGDFARMMYGSL